MPTKSNNMSPMPMQSKIGEASLKFGPDWLRALSSSETQGNNVNNSPSPGGDTGGGGRDRFGFSGWGNPEGRSSFHSNNKDLNFSATSNFSSAPPSFHQQQSHHQSRELKGTITGPPPGHSNVPRFKQSEHQYSREEMLALYDKNLEAPSFLLSFGTLYIEKMQPPLAFSQPSEDEIRIWHIPQPESSRQGPGTAPVGRGYAARGRGGGIDRGRGRGRGAYYGSGRPHEEEERGSFSRPRNFERSQSNHERTSWGERNGVVGGPGPVTPEENNRGGGNWRSRESFGGGGGGVGVGGTSGGSGSSSARRQEENEDGWRKPRWRRGDEEEEYRSGSSRRLHRSWSEEENHENIPEWARDNPSEESGTFDSSGAFHGDERSNKNRETDRKLDDSNSMKPRNESEPSGSHSDRVQKRVQDRTESVKPVIPASVKEETEVAGGDEDDYMSASLNRQTRDRSDPFPHPYQQANSIMNIQKGDSELQQHQHIMSEENRVLDSRLHQQNSGVGVVHSHQLHKQHIQTVQHQMSSSHEVRAQMMHHSQSLPERNASSNAVLQQTQVGDLRASNSLETKMPLVHNSRNEEDHYRSMTEEAMNLVSKLIEEDGSGSRRGSPGKLQGQRTGVMPHPQHPQQQQHLGAVNTDPANNASINVNDLSRANNNPSSMAHPNQNIPPPQVRPPSASPASMDVWFYRDPQGSVQGPFSTHEMGLWYSQGYFLGSLLLRRECDKVFITLQEMGKMYGGNPLFSDSNNPPPPIQDPNSALDFPRGDGSQLQAQLHQQRQHQQLLQQNMLREQYMMNIGHGGIRKEDPGWMGQNMPQPQQAPQQTRSVPNAPSSLTSEQIQTQLLMSMAKSQGIDRDPHAIDQLQALFQRQLKNSNSDGIMSQPQSQKGSYPDMMHRQNPLAMDVPKSPTPVTDPIQSLVQQLTSMANTQHQKISAPTKPEVISPWGQSAPVNAVQSQAPNQWGTSHPNSVPWEYREQIAKLQQEEEIRRRKEEEDTERKRLDDEERNRIEEQQRQEIRDRKRNEDQLRLDEEKQRKMREEQYLLQKQQQELVRKQQEDAELQRQKELQRQQLEQQRQLRDEQTRLAEEQIKIEQQRLDKDRKAKEQDDRDLKVRQERERDRQDQLKLQQQFSWNASAPPPAQTAAGGKSILEIQQEESIKEEKEASLKKKQREEQLRIQQQQQAQLQKNTNLKWAQGTAAPVKGPIKSLTEIQAEEQAKLQKQQDQDREKRAIITQHQQQQAAWSAQLTWANRASTLAASGGGGSGSGSKKINGGVWEESSMASKLKASNNTSPSSSNNRSQSSGGKKTKEMSEDAFMKMFAVQDNEKSPRPKTQSMGGGSNDEFTRWCSDRIQAIASGSVDIPTFVSFLKEVESPYDVGDYVRSYLGDGKEAKEFSREFLERRSRWKNACKTGGGSIEDNLCRPASAVNPNSNDFQEVKAKGKKTKKGKMQKVDSRILGFSTSAAADRLNRDYGDSTD